MKRKWAMGVFGALCMISVAFAFTSCSAPGNIVGDILGDIIGGNPLHTHDYTQKVAEDSFLESEATCEKKATYYYSCTCGKKGTEVFEDGDYSLHDWEEGKCTVCKTDYYSEGLGYELSEDASYYILTGMGTCTDTDLVIPATYGEKPVKVIGNDAFYKANNLASVIIPDGVTSLRNYAFCSCPNLTGITIPDSVISIGYNAIAWCDLLTNVTFGENSELTTIGSQAFSYCGSLKNIAIPDSVTSIGYGAFGDCANLQYTVEGNCKYLGNNNNSYVYLVGTTSKKIASATINANCKLIGYSAFSWHKQLQAIAIPDSVVSIGDDAFSSCELLSSVTFGENSRLTSIGAKSFYYCDSLQSITIPKEVTSIDNWAFRFCESLTEIAFKDANNWYRTADYTNWQNKVGGAKIDVTNSSDNVDYFTDNSYDFYYWYKK